MSALGRPWDAPGPLDAIVVDAASRAGLVCVRSLGRAGLRVGAFDQSRSAPAFSSRWCRACGWLPSVGEDPAMLGDSVIALARDHGPSVVVPSHDGTLEALRTQRDELERHARLAAPPESALQVAVSKPRTLEVARSLGIGIPRSAPVANAADVEAALDEIGLPAVLKPSQSWAPRTRSRVVSVLAMDRGSARDAITRFERHGIGAIAQQWLPGRREAVSLFYADGRVWARFAQVAYRMTPPLGGSSVLRESIEPPADIADAAERLAHEINLEGYTEIEFRRDDQGRAALMEINPRLSASIEIAVRSGVDFPRLIHRWGSGMPLEPVDGYRRGLRMRWLGGDLEWLYWVRRLQGSADAPPFRQALGTFVRDFTRSTTYDYVDREDPRPALVATGTFLRKAITEGKPPR